MKNLKKEFARYVSLNITAMLGLSFYILGDTYFVARATGPDGLAALNIAIPAYSLFVAIGHLLGVGGATKFSLLGGRRSKSTSRIFTHAVYLGLIASAVFMIAGIFFIEPLSRLLGADNNTIGYTITYTRTLLIASPFFVFNNMLNAFVRNDKNPKLAMVAMLTGSIMNVVLDYTFMFPLGMGMFGAAFATALAPVIGIAILSVHIIKKKNNFVFKPVKMSFGISAETIKPGLSAFVTEISNGLVIFVFNMLMLGLVGNIGVTAYGIVANIALVAIAVLNGIAQGMQPLVSSYYGRGERKTSMKLYGYALVLALFAAVLIYTISFIGVNGIVSLFNGTGSTKLQNIAEKGIIIYFIGFFAAGINIVSASYFGAIGNAAISFFIGCLRAVALIIPVAFIMAKLFGVNGVWSAFPITEFMVCIVSITAIIYAKHREKIKKSY